MAPINTTNDANGAKGTGTPHTTAHASISASSAMELDMESSNATSPTKDAKPDEYAASPMTILGWPTLTALRTSGPSDDEKDINKGVMSRETSRT
jgi:hypothetical protein